MKTIRDGKAGQFITPPKLTRGKAEKMAAVEGLKLSPKMAEAFRQFDRQGLTNDQRREAVKAEFRKKYT